MVIIFSQIQDDLFIGTLTVKEHLVFQAKVRMDRDIPFKQRMERVETVMMEVMEDFLRAVKL